MDWDNATFEIGEYVGLSWQPHGDIEFYVEDLRIVNEKISGNSWFEYKVVRRDYVYPHITHSTGWHNEEKLFKVQQPVK